MVDAARAAPVARSPPAPSGCRGDRHIFRHCGRCRSASRRSGSWPAGPSPDSGQPRCPPRRCRPPCRPAASRPEVAMPRPDAPTSDRCRSGRRASPRKSRADPPNRGCAGRRCWASLSLLVLKGSTASRSCSVDGRGSVDGQRLALDDRLSHRTQRYTRSGSDRGSTRTQMSSHYPRDLVGYGRNPPDPRWPGRARVAVQFVVNYEEGGENSILHGDKASEAFLTDVLGAQPWPGQRHMNIESMFEYGSRAGFWRLWRMFTERKLPVTVFGVASALARNPEVVAGMREASWEIASHGLKWIDYKDIPEAQERDHMREALRIHAEVTGERPLGWYTG